MSKPTNYEKSWGSGKTRLNVIQSLVTDLALKQSMDLKSLRSTKSVFHYMDIAEKELQISNLRIFTKRKRILSGPTIFADAGDGMIIFSRRENIWSHGGYFQVFRCSEVGIR